MILDSLGRHLPRSLRELPIPIDETEGLGVGGLLREAGIVMSRDEEALGVLDLVEVVHNDIRPRERTKDT
jgi:hypothetical protein